MRVVLTGCAGFIGSHLAERLVAEGFDVTGIDAFTSYYDPAEKWSNLAGLVGERRFELLEGDLVDLPLERILADRPLVVHLAAQPGVRGSFGEQFGQYVHDNVLATQRVFEAATTQRCERVVFASSSSIYGDADTYPVLEDVTPRAPKSPYGVTKATCEDLARIYRSNGLSTVGLRYFTVYGPRQRPDMAMRRLCETAVGGPAFRLHGDGLQSRDFTYVADAVEATLRAMLVPGVEAELNIGGGQEATMREVIDLLGSIAGHRLPIEMGAPQRGDVRRTGADTARARKRLGWAPTTTLDDGLAAQYAWVAERAGLAVPVGVGA